MHLKVILFLFLSTSFSVEYTLSLSDYYAQQLSDHCPNYKPCPINLAADNIEPEHTCCLRCSCDYRSCSVRGNCCPDVTAHNDANNVTAHNDANDATIQRQTPQKRFECVPTTLNIMKKYPMKIGNATVDISSLDAKLGVYMIKSCLEGRDDIRCTYPNVTLLDENIPHISIPSLAIYRNYYCALCNDDDTYTLPWQTIITCSDIDVVKSSQLLFPNNVDKVYEASVTSKKKYCGVEFLPPTDFGVSKIDMCYSNDGVINSCSNTSVSQELKDFCENTNIPFVNNEENVVLVYANPFCHLCRSYNKTDSGNTNTCPNDVTKLTVYTDNRFVAKLNTGENETTPLMLPWIQTDLPSGRYNPDSEHCGASSIYDFFQERCRRWYCPHGRQLIDGRCVPIFSDVIKITYVLQLKITPDKTSQEEFNVYNKTEMVKTVLDQMFWVGPDIKKEMVVLAVKQDDSFVFVSFLLHILESTTNLPSLFDPSTYGNDYTFEGVNGSMIVSADLSEAIKLELSTFPLSDIVVIDLADYTVLINIYRVDIEGIEESFRFSPITKLDFCTQVLLERSEIHDYVDIVEVKISDTRIHIGQFSRSSMYSTVRVCMADYFRRAEAHLEYLRKMNEYSPQAILSVVCNFLSIIGLIVTIVTYIIFDELRSIPGKNNMMLAIHLLIAQCLYQFGMDQTETPTLCIVLGLLIHMFWLITIFWMNACTLHMFRTFVTGQSYRSNRAFDPQVCCYAFYCYGLAACMVSINVAISMYRSDGEDLGYGGRVCYISNPAMVGWVFALPVGIIIVLNMGFFFAVVYQISVSTMRRRGKQTDRANTIIYMKLSSLTGVTWIFGYLYLWTNFVPFEYIFIVLNAGQGVLIFISFICTKRVTKLYGILFRKYRSRYGDCYCLCLSRKPMTESEANGVDINTAKISLTAGSSTKGALPYQLRAMNRARDAGFQNKGANKKTLDNNSVSLANNSSTGSDIFKESYKIAKAVINPTFKTLPDEPIEIDNGHYNVANDASSLEGDDAIGTLPVAAISINDVEFSPNANE